MPLDHALGSPSWFELATTDQSAAKRFYEAVFGWKAKDNALPDGSVYTIFELGGREVAACYTMMPEQAQAMRPAWGVYFRVADADAAAAGVRAGGGQVITEPFEVMEHLRMAVCADPEGAMFSLHQARAHKGVAAIRENNAINWVELATRDIDKAEAFYRSLFGWETEDFPAGPTRYLLYGSRDAKWGGLLQMTPEWGDMPSHWSIYVQVEDVDATIARATAAGGSVCVPPFDIPKVGRIARIDDPSGAGFYLIAPNPN